MLEILCPITTMASTGEETTELAHTRQFTLGSNSGEVDPLGLPLRELHEDANLEEFVIETTAGNFIKHKESNAMGRMEDWKLVTFKTHDPENPKNWSKAKKWHCTMVVAFTCFVVAFCSAVVTAGLTGPVKTFNVSMEVSLLTITVFVVGFGIGMVRSKHTEVRL